MGIFRFHWFGSVAAALSHERTCSLGAQTLPPNASSSTFPCPRPPRRKRGLGFRRRGRRTPGILAVLLPRAMPRGASLDALRPWDRETPSAPWSLPILHPVSRLPASDPISSECELLPLPVSEQGPCTEEHPGPVSLLGGVFQPTVQSTGQPAKARAGPPPTFCTAHKLRICFQMNFYNRFNDSDH